jgi:hypothetical protein
VRSGLDAVTLTASGELPRRPADDALSEISADRLTRFGRAAFASTLAFDGPRFNGAAAHRDLVLGRNVLPSWALALLAAALTLPVLVAGIDAAARGRRRRVPVGETIGWALGASAAFAITVVTAAVFDLVDWLPGTIEEAVSPYTAPSAGEAAPALLALLLVLALAWITVRRLFPEGPRPGDAGSGGAAIASLLAAEVLVLCAVNPYAGLLLVPAAHLALLSALPERPRRSVLVSAIVAGGLVLPLLALSYYGLRLDLGLSPDSYGLMVVTAFSGSLGAAVLGSLLAGTLVSAVLVAMRAARVEGPAEVTVRGPVTYAGPGSLGGTESALRR